MITLTDREGREAPLRLGAVSDVRLDPVARQTAPVAKARQEAYLVDHFFTEMQRTATGGMTRGLARLKIIEDADVPADMAPAITPTHDAEDDCA